jgi:glycosyltransferase involved in cell wall biosynthesis
MLVADQVVVLTAEYRKELHEALGLLFRPSKVRVIPNGIDTELFTPRLPQRDVWTDRIRLGMAARFSFSKRQDLLVSVMSRLGTLRPDLSFELRFAGDGVELERVKNYASASLYSTHIHFDGLLDEKEVAHWMRNLDVYLQATDGETLSTSLLQAMATGLPIVASAVDGVTNLLGSKGEYGLCAANVVDDFAKAILHIIDSPDLSIAMSSRARQRSLNFNSQVMLASYSKLASEVLE